MSLATPRIEDCAFVKREKSLRDMAVSERRDLPLRTAEELRWIILLVLMIR